MSGLDINTGSVFLKLHIYKIIDGKPARTDKVKDNEDHHIDERKFSLRQKTVMDVKECDSHGDYHRQDHDSEKNTGYKEERAAEFAEDSDHQRHIAAKSKDARICEGQLGKVHHLTYSMNKEHDSEENSENKDQGRYTFSSEMLGKQKFVKHNI